MKRYLDQNDDKIGIGEMAEHFNISSRTLRLYHDMGLLEPKYVDDSNGYRYYSRDQFQRLDKILQMRAVGLSLGQIKSMLDQRNLSVFEALLNERIDELNERIANDSASRDLLIKQLNSCSRLRNPPVLDSAFVEFLPKRHALDFSIRPYYLRQEYPDGSPWEQAMEDVKKVLLENHLPLSLLHQSCCTITQQDLMAGKYICSGALLLMDVPMHTALPQKVIQSGTYACLYRRYNALNGMSESIGLDKLLAFIAENHYQIVGPYLGEVVAKMSIFDYSDDTILVKLQIPIKISE